MKRSVEVERESLGRQVVGNEQETIVAKDRCQKREGREGGERGGFASTIIDDI